MLRVLFTVSESGDTVLMMAAKEGYLEIVQLLVKARVSLNDNKVS